jgi:hypothetical protein
MWENFIQENLQHTAAFSKEKKCKSVLHPFFPATLSGWIRTFVGCDVGCDGCDVGVGCIELQPQKFTPSQLFSA